MKQKDRKPSDIETYTIIIPPGLNSQLCAMKIYLQAEMEFRYNPEKYVDTDDAVTQTILEFMLTNRY